MLDTPDLKSRLQFESTELFILRVMVASIILYDHVHPSGAFARGNKELVLILVFLTLMCSIVQEHHGNVRAVYIISCYEYKIGTSSGQMRSLISLQDHVWM